jgi:hypothetical protein
MTSCSTASASLCERHPKLPAGGHGMLDWIDELRG